MSKRYRIIFMGTAELACASLRALHASPLFEVVLVVTQPDKPKGRDLKLQPTAVKAAALELGLPVEQPLKARAIEFVEHLKTFAADLIVVAAYGQLLPQSILDLPKYGCLNVHTSVLPKYRGAAPIQWAIIDGEAETGVTIMKMDAGLDTGDILTIYKTPIAPEDNAATLHDRLAVIGAEALITTIPRYVNGEIKPQPQPAMGSTYARKITKDDGRMDWSQPARVLFNRIRGLTPWPGAFTFLAPEQKLRLLKIWQTELVTDAGGQPGKVLQADKTGIVVACGEGALRIASLQREGGRRMTAAEFSAGQAVKAGDVFYSE
ncbi:MAG: methionyl-tRNA formyltransferase [Verrucomicrobia bacterium]|jgi:methionyl-tRNA formyltransferase|nr:methionyl-tRNA formyltransferase [Verrucomicrobiota bacterium]